MVDEKKDQESGKEEIQSYRTIGMIFLVAGLGLIIPEGTRATGIPFLVLGLTFIALGVRESSSKRKKK